MKNKQINWPKIRFGKQFPIVAARAVTVCSLLLLAWALGRIAWIWVSPEQEVTVASPQTMKPKQRNTETYQIEQLTDQNLFGTYEATGSLNQGVVTNAPKTKLNLTLVGVVSSTDPKQALAVISNGGTQQIYAIDETIKNSRAVLKQVLSDRVVLRNGGQDEILMLDGVEFDAKVSGPLVKKSSSGNKKPSSAGDGAGLTKIKAEILQNPQALLKYITLSQQRNEQGVVGYRIGPGSDSRLFNEAGLKSNDIVVNINGSDIRNPAELAGIWKKLSDASEINLTVLRNGQEHNVLIGL